MYILESVQITKLIDFSDKNILSTISKMHYHFKTPFVQKNKLSNTDINKSYEIAKYYSLPLNPKYKPWAFRGTYIRRAYFPGGRFIYGGHFVFVSLYQDL